MRGIKTILITGRILNNSIPIGADTMQVSIMTRIFIINTIAARGEVGIRDSMAIKAATVVTGVKAAVGAKAVVAPI